MWKMFYTFLSSNRKQYFSFQSIHHFQNYTQMNRKAKTPQKSDSQTLALIHDFFHWNWMAAAIVVNFFAPVSSSYKGL